MDHGLLPGSFSGPLRGLPFKLNDDSLIQVISMLGNFTDLRSLMLSCRALRAFYLRHRRFLLNAIGRSALGTALPFALRAVHALRITFYESATDEEGGQAPWSMPAIPSERDFPHAAREWSFTSAKLLDKLAVQARELELNYSRKYVECYSRSI
jgi:hypothetical protein